MDDSSKPMDDFCDESSVRQQQVGDNGISSSLRMEENSSEGDNIPGTRGEMPLDGGGKPEDEENIGPTGPQHNAEGHRKLEGSIDGNKFIEISTKYSGEIVNSKLEHVELIVPIGQQEEADSTRQTENSLDDSIVSGIYPKVAETLDSDPKDEPPAGPAGRQHVGKREVEDSRTMKEEGNAKSEKSQKLPQKRQSKPNEEHADSPQTKDSSKYSKTSDKFQHISGKRDRKPKYETLMKPLGRQQRKAESSRKTAGSSKGKTNSSKSANQWNRGLVKLTKRFKTFGVTVNKLWDVWGRFKTRNSQDPNPTVSDKTLGVPGFEEIACIEAEVPDIMVTDKDRVRTSCKECMQHTPAFPSKEQIKAKLIAADKYYGVNGTKSHEHSGALLEHEADYYNDDGTVVRPSWRFILERPLVEQYVLMTNYIRKVSVISELKEERIAMKFIEEEDPESDTEYKKFEQKLLKERRELLKPMLKPKTQEIGQQTSFIWEQTHKEEFRESVSEISLYPESEESTNSPDASAVTIVTSRDYSSPLQSDFDGRTTDKSASYKEGNWWESQACQPSESFQTSLDSVHNKVSSGSDGQSIPVKAAWGETCFRPSNDNGWITSSHRTDEDPTMFEPKGLKKVHFSPVVTYYQGPEKNAAVYRLPGNFQNPPQNTQDETHGEDRTAENPGTVEEPKTPEAKPTRPKTLNNILQERKSDQIVSVTLPEGWHKNRILHNKQKLNVAISRSTAGNRPTTKKMSFQSYEEIPGPQYSNPQISTVREKTDAKIQTQTQAAQQNIVGRIKAATSATLTKLETVQSGYTNAHFKQPERTLSQNFGTIDTNINVNSRRNGQQVMESVGTGTNIQSSGNHQVTPRKKQGTTGKHSLDAPAKLLPSPTRLQLTSNALALYNFPSANQSSRVSRIEIPQDNLSNYQVIQKSTFSDGDVKNDPRYVRPRTLSDPSLSERLPKTVPGTFRKPQQGSTDTEGSSTSNDHIKLKASPACFFKIATPTDLSKISVDDFYPDVPDIDAELSQNGETSTTRAIKDELGNDKGSALECIPDTYIRNHRIPKKEDDSILQSSADPGMMIMVSPGIEIRDITQQTKTSIAIPKVPTMAEIQNSSEKDESHIQWSAELPKKESITGKVKQERQLEIGAKQILYTKEVCKIGTLKEVRLFPPDPQKQQTKTEKQQLLLTMLNKDKFEDSCGEDVMGKALKCPQQLLRRGGTMTDDDHKVEIRREKLEMGTLERQLDNIVNDQENQSPLGRAKTFVRTLSSLAEETSSVMEATSSAADNTVDTAVIARPVEELKTIFEKKSEASSSVVPELRENQSNKCMEVPEGMLQTIQGNGIPEEETEVVKGAGTSQSKENFCAKIPGECSGLPTGQNLPSDVEKLATLKEKNTRVIKSDENRTTHSDIASDVNKNPALVQEEFSAQQLSQIDVIRPSEIYSNTSMYFSTSEERVARFTKARTAFEPMTLDDEEASCTSGNAKSLEKLPTESHAVSKDVTFKDEYPEQQQKLKPETKYLSSYRRDSYLVGHSNMQTMMGKKNNLGKNYQETLAPPANTGEVSSGVIEHNGINTNEAAGITRKADLLDDKSEPAETKQWLMNVIPMFSKHTRFHGIRLQKSGAVINRQEAVKPVFQFLKRQRDMEHNK